jgi:hypothetical protein
MGRKVAYLHVVDHPLAMDCHGNLLCKMEGAISSHPMLSQRRFLWNPRVIGRRGG